MRKRASRPCLKCRFKEICRNPCDEFFAWLNTDDNDKEKEQKMDELKKYYYTYGTENQPYRGGWTEVEAPSAFIASAVFRLIHPDNEDGLMNCAGMYTEENFKQTNMYVNGNFGAKCYEKITLNIELKSGYEE